MKRIYLLGLFMSFLIFSVSGQRNCATMENLEKQLLQSPKLGDKMEKIEQATRNFIARNQDFRVSGVITIPVVVHVVYNNSTENISQAQIESQITVLNNDFRRLNSDADNTWSQADDVEIQFCLASVDPNGNPTSGITRTSTSVTAFGTNDQMKFNSSGGKDAWPAGDYLNMWVCDISGSILGYAQFPGGSPATDGVVMDYQYFGTVGTATAPFDLGRTTTHEVGHWLNLRHIWGDGNCNADDFVADTPGSDAPNYGCAIGHVSCNTVDMVQNYMDYSDDACMNLFTSGQKARMRALFDTGGARASLLNSGGCGSTNPPTCSDGIQNGDETGVDCGGASCPTCPSGCNGTEVTVTIKLDNYPEETSWVIRNSSNTVVASGGTYGSQPDGSTVTQTICLPDGCYNFIISDAYGDGICCAYGNGFYTVTSSSGTLASGGSFQSSETTNFCIGGGPAPTCSDGIQNGDETGVDCGGSNCAPCVTCSDGIQNGDETGVDCGGSNCAPCVTCSDGIQNGDETGVDCGGSNCAPCVTCSDGIQNGDETGVDCGGSNCAPCITCSDGIQNGDETGIDCGGSTCPACPSGCNGTEVTVSIKLDNYPSETSWRIVNQSGAMVASGGTYGGQASGSTVNITECLPDGCYTFTIFDTYGDGICCSYGSGSYTVSSAAGTLASGGSFGSSESTAFCVGGGSAPSCTDGIQNGDETGVDCGGSACGPCGNTGCSNVDIDFNNFESSYGIWNDGGTDCIRTNNPANAYSGSICILLRDNTSTSVLTTGNLNLAGYEEVTIAFTYIAQSMETGEDFWLQASTNGGSTYQTLVTWASGTDFSNNVREFESIVITGNFTSNTRFRFRCDASTDTDYIYLDDISIAGCVNNQRESLRSDQEGIISLTEDADVMEIMSIHPNPVSELLNVHYTLEQTKDVQFNILDMAGRVIKSTRANGLEGKNAEAIDVTNLNAGIYYLQLQKGDQQLIRKFVVIR